MTCESRGRRTGTETEEGKNDDPAGMEILSGSSLCAVDKKGLTDPGIIGEETEEDFTLRLARNSLTDFGVEELQESVHKMSIDN